MIDLLIVKWRREFNAIMEKIKLDLIGQKCPVPLTSISKEFRKRNKGTVIKAKSDDKHFPDNLKTYCDITGYELVSFDESDGIYTAIIRKT